MIHPFLQSSIAAYRATAERARETRLHSDMAAALLAADRLACLVEVVEQATQQQQEPAHAPR